jgi:GT2 family glycosyltransferase
MTSVSVVIPSYKGVHLYKKNLQAVLDCMRDQDELIVVDDASGPEDDTTSWFQKQFRSSKQTKSLIEETDFYLGEYREKNKKLRIVL